MSDDALLSTPSAGRQPESSGWQQGRMDEAQGRTASSATTPATGEAPWLTAGGGPVGSNSFSPPVSQAAGHYGAGYGDPTQHLGMGGPVYHDEHHQHFQRLRDEHARQLDEDYAAWRRHRFDNEFGQWRRSRQGQAQPQDQDELAPRREGPLHSLGRAISETVTGSREPDLDEVGDAQRERNTGQRFFERA
jgi:hypothetical protein